MLTEWEIAFLKKYLERYPDEKFVEELKGGKAIRTNKRFWGISVSGAYMTGTQVSVWCSGEEKISARFLVSCGVAVNVKDDTDSIITSTLNEKEKYERSSN